MAPKKQKSVPSAKSCMCGGDCKEKHSRLPGYLLMAFGFLALPINFDMIPGLEWLKAWPLFLVLMGAVIAIKVTLCRRKS